MKTIEFAKYGSPDYLRMIEVEKPVPATNEVLVKIHAASINSWDLELLHARPFANRIMFGLFKPTKLKTLGFDIAGRVEAVGRDVKKFQAGDEVYGDLSACGWGGFAEYVAAPETALAKKPSTLSFQQAAAVPQAALLALQGLVDVGHIRPGQKVLINGASGGSGTFAIQIARTFGVEITGVCSTAKMAFVRSLGVDHVIDYTQHDFTRSGIQYDLIIDAQARYSLFDYRRALRANGVYVMHGGASSSIFQVMLLGPLVSRFGSRTLRLLFHKANKGLDAMSALLESGKVVPVIDKVFAFADTIEALRYYGAGHAQGKVVISMEHENSKQSGDSS
jgi:NADPH:quinone reductase-like Zn-dependent oxidoreductase